VKILEEEGLHDCTLEAEDKYRRFKRPIERLKALIDYAAFEAWGARKPGDDWIEGRRIELMDDAKAKDKD
jgi:hypothetical protein